MNLRSCYRLVLMMICIITGFSHLHAENGYDLWLRYKQLTNASLKQVYQQKLPALIVTAHSATLDIAAGELSKGIQNLLGRPLAVVDLTSDTTDSKSSSTQELNTKDGLLIGRMQKIMVGANFTEAEKKRIGTEGYYIRSVDRAGHQYIIIAANSDIGVLYGSFHLLRLMQTGRTLSHLNIEQAPKLKLRILDHWDNLNGTIERGYAGYSIWNWQTLPGIIQKRYVDYARANASIGINGTVLNNVNADVKSLTKAYLIKTAALAKTFAPYGIKVYLTAKFSAPKELGRLGTADPLDPAVIRWWKDKVAEIYHYIPNFGGFLVKASSEGQPGPGDYGRTHADGANMMATALKPYGGIVIWRTFVYQNKKGEDRAKQGYNEFKPLDGKFAKNVLLQAKYGPIDFQPREAFNPLFGAMPKTQMMMEFEITQEYYGFATHLVYLGTLFQQYLQEDTYRPQKRSTIAKVLEGKTGAVPYDEQRLTGMAGVANIGTDINWCGHPFAQANWYAYGRFAWDPESSADSLADDWLRMTFDNDTSFVNPVKKMMLASREIAVDYMTPLGLSHLMNSGNHYGPGPWGRIAGVAGQNYHHSDSMGIGVNRTKTGSNAVEQYASPVRKAFSNPATTPLNLLLWFHHIGWDQQLRTGKTLWNELATRYYEGAESVHGMEQLWQSMEGKLDADRFEYVLQLLKQQYIEAKWWRDGCVLYFQKFSNRALPKGFVEPDKKPWKYPSFKPELPFPYNY